MNACLLVVPSVGKFVCLICMYGCWNSCWFVCGGVGVPVHGAVHVYNILKEGVVIIVIKNIKKT